MIRINLLPFRAARKSENIRRQVSIFFLTLTLVVLVMGFLQIKLNAQINDLKSKVDSTSKELVIYQKKAKEVDEIKKKLDNLKKRNDVIVELDKNRKEPVTLLDEMTQLIIPNRMWITSFSASGNNISIAGIALDNNTTAEFMTRLEGSELFTNVNLQSVKHQVINNRKMKSFQISCDKKPKTSENS